MNIVGLVSQLPIQWLSLLTKGSRGILRREGFLAPLEMTIG